MVNEVEQNTYGTLEVKYYRPKFIHRVLANMIDFIIFAIMFVALFLSARGIVQNTTSYQSTFNDINSMRLDSGLYIQDGTRIVDIVSYMNSNQDYNYEKTVNTSEKVINTFFTYEVDYLSEEKLNQIKGEYNKLRLDKVTENNVHYFVTEGEEIVKNSELYNTSKYLYSSFYKDYIDKYLQGYLVTTPHYYDLTKILNNYLIFAELPPAFVLAVILTYYVPTLFFRRGRATLGKALYRIGTVDSRYLSPKFGRNTAKWAIFLVEMIAGVASLGVIFILSFSMMAFSKNRQGFPDYMLGLQEVDANRTKVYYSLEEIKLEGVDSHKKPTEFRLRDNP